MKRYRASDGTVWFQLDSGRLVKARSLVEAQKKQDDGAYGWSKNEVRNQHGPLQEL